MAEKNKMAGKKINGGGGGKAGKKQNGGGKTRWRGKNKMARKNKMAGTKALVEARVFATPPNLISLISFSNCLFTHA